MQPPPNGVAGPSYPGLGLDLCHERHDYPRYRSSVVGMLGESDESEILFVREVAMMIFMDRITDKPGWHEKVFDEGIAKRWVKEALETDPELFWHEMHGVTYEPPEKQPSHRWREFAGPPVEDMLDEASLDYVS